MNLQNINDDRPIILDDNTTLRMRDLQLLFSCGMESAKVNDMLTVAKRNYVKSKHSRAIFKLPPSKSWKNGCFKTYVYVDSKRKEITSSTEDKLIEKLYDFYYEEDNKAKTLGQVFELFMDYKKTCLNRSDKTIVTDRNRFKHVPQQLLEKDINEITDEDIRRFIVSNLLPNNPKPDFIKRMLQSLGAVFNYGIKKKICFDNPVRYIEAQDYYKQCDQKVKTDEEKAFSSEELSIITADAEKYLDNPRVLMSLLAKETGMRAGELAALHVDDVNDDFIHVHRQQIKVREGNHNNLVEVGYTKDERLHPHNGRFIPITDEARRVISLAKAIPGDSLYLFHDSNCSNMVPTDGYVHNLRKRCKRLGCIPTNNHAFRMAFNSRLIEIGLSPSDRALILGHEVQTNEAHYSLTDKRRLNNIKERIKNEES
ncbi:tyrosine-type recombinase/integrase [Lachnobacterium bovis]|uniref:Site-specific recombinase XerD n=1 Tax=Lachnobacterium bovis DSM 14045 TaxID=1122142 RepID=A0A1H3M8K7_9FIRM|nr:tyrosine-type recombinase/integrase [Lachnobacterium bovis]SDY72345.1 Site-specific recombinase XerD [Lachnobacterium bovis DSM 14045]